MRHLYLFVIFIIFTSLNICIESKSRKDVSVSLISKWNPFGFDQSVGEFIWEYNNSKYWEFIEGLTDDLSKLSKNTFTDQEIYDLSSDVAFKLMPFDRYQFLRSSLTYDYFSPQLSLFRQLAYDVLQRNNIDIKEFKYTSWVYAYGTIITSVNELKSKLLSENQQSSKPNIANTIYEFDHIYFSSNIFPSDNPVYYLYSSPLSNQFKEFHELLKKTSQENKIQYILRPWQPVEDFDSYQPLQGYGVELALKNVEYKTIDEKDKAENINIDSDDETESIAEGEEEPIGGFLFNTLIKNYPMYESQFISMKAHIINTESGYENMKPWEIQGIGKKASYHILSSKNPLKTLRDVSHNLPFMASLISRTEYTNETVKAMIRKTEQYEFPEPLLLINGKFYDIDTFSIFKFHNILNQEISKAEILSDYGIPNTFIKELLQKPFEQDEQPLYFNINRDNIIFFNDIERDDLYRIYSKSFRNIFFENEQYPHISIRKNLMHITMILDINQKDARSSLLYLLQMYTRKLPFRMGVMFTLPDNLKKMSDEEILNDYNSLMSMCLHSVSNNYNRYLVSFLQQSLGDIDQLKQSCHRLFSPTSLLDQEKKWLFSVHDELNSKGLNAADIRLILLNGKLSNAKHISNEFFHDLVLLKKEIISLAENNEIDESTDVYEYYQKKYNSLDLYHPKIFDKKPTYIPLKLNTYPQLLKSLDYLYPTGIEEKLFYITHLINSDFSSIKGRNFAMNILRYLEDKEHKDQVRLTFFNDKYYTEKEWNDPNTSVLLRSIQSILKNTDQMKKETFEIIKKLLETNSLTFETAKSIAKDINGFETTYFSSELLISMNLQAKFASQLNLSGKATIITNGYIISLDQKDLDNWNDKYMRALYKYESNFRSKGILGFIKKIDLKSKKQFMDTNTIHSLLIPIISNIKYSDQVYHDQLITEALSNAYRYSQPNSYIHIVLVINPLSPEAQKLTGILLPKINILPIDVSLLLIPRQETVFPLKNFYRFMHQDIKFDQNGKRKFDPLVFDNLPQNKLLSMNIHPPEQWLVEPIKCDYDLDNILLNEVNENINAVFQLEYILMEGRCFDIDENDPPTGLQLVLNDVITNYTTDTLVMQNLGYFQLKANPGLFKLKLSKGRSEDIYEIVEPKDNYIVISSFYSDYISLKVKKKQGKEKETLLIEDGEKENQSIWDSISGLFKKDSTDKKDDDVINIFSVASGHLYERFLRNMMVSVVNNTKSKVKFWIIKNFLSPTFKNTIHRLADQFDFEVELVQYKWPSWLRHQTEKQRIIWGYKILFLDVIFPLSVKKFIYIDSDQIVRADVKELYDMDLKGAVYGFTPFCQGEIKRKETEQFRFWESGFWKDYLRGKPYHISALFVVDLQKFRYRGVGDIIRMTYEHLSADPNSLANLDQDLPNALQHQIKIFSLPREWLWCETWCTDESKKDAKTIDLCNNPLTKTPKLQNALKVIEEWQTIDNTVRSVLENKQVDKKDDNIESTKTNVKDEL